jgi:hypothetical protein
MRARVEKDDAAILRDLKAQVKRLCRSKVYPNQVHWPAGRKVFVQVMTRDIGRSFRMGEVLQPLMVYLDAPPEWTRELNPDPAMGSIIPASGTTGYLRVR